MSINYKIAIVVILLVTLLLVIKFRWRGTKKEKVSTKRKNNKKNTKNNRKEKISGRRAKKRHEPQEESSEDSSEDDNENMATSKNVDNELREDAEDLYNLVHEQLAQGMSPAEFEEIAGDLANDFSFIELQQLYNQAIDKNMDPIHSITVNDYIKVLEKEEDDF